MKDIYKKLIESNSMSINDIAETVYKLNNDLSIVSKDNLRIAIENEILIIYELIYHIIEKDLFNKDILLDVILPNENYDFLTAKYEMSTINHEVLLDDGFALLKLYEKLQNQKDKKIFGQYYTPIVIMDRMVSDIDIVSYSEKKLKILDPACGVGAFLLKIIDKCICEIKDYDKIKVFLNNCVYGNDINTNSIIMTRLCLILQLKKHFYTKNILEDFKSFLHNIKNVNSLYYEENCKYSLILGNPPYFKTKINERLIKEYCEIIYGQPNVYSLFVYWAIEMVEEDGEVSFVIPQSIMSGKYFEKLRNVLLRYDILLIDLINSKTRSKLFKNAEQAVMIISIKKSNKKGPTIVKYTSFDSEDTSLRVENQEDIFKDEFITFPKSENERLLIKKLSNLPKLSNVIAPYKFGNGLFVWNQQKQNLSIKKENAIPIIYANYIKDDMFIFDPQLNNFDNEDGRKAFCFVNESNKNFQFYNSLLIVKRTSSLNGFRRIKCAIIEEDIIKNYQSFFIENHLNILYDKTNKSKEIPKSFNKFIYYYLKSTIANYYFKKINGNTQVSSIELNNLPFYQESLDETELSKIDFKTNTEINNYFYEKFKLSKKDIEIIEREVYE